MLTTILRRVLATTVSGVAMVPFRWFKVLVNLLVIGSLVVIVPSASVESARTINQQIDIYPDSPSFFQPFFVTVSGQWADSCTPIFHSMDVSERTVRLQTKTPGPLVPCTDAETDWGVSVLVPPRPPDMHAVELSIVSGITGQTLSFVRQGFTVKGGIQVVPGLPLSTQDVTLRLADLSPDSCVPQYSAFRVVTQTVTIEAQIPDQVCGQTPTPWQIETPIGPLAVGDYQAELFVTDHRQTPPGRTRLLEQSTVVVEQILHTFMPQWGCFGLDLSPQACAFVQPPDSQRRSP